MTRKKKGPAPKRKPVVRRVVKAEPTLIETTFPDGGKMFTISPPPNSDKVYVYNPAPPGPDWPYPVPPPSRWSRVVAWVRENGYTALLVICSAFGALAGAWVAERLIHG